jgi:hypothetical protein
MLIWSKKTKYIKERLARTVKKDVLRIVKEEVFICHMEPLSVAVMLAFQFEPRTP